MFLKRLETVGFKSFAERIQIEFVPGVTAVVGPNGSGKSNIIDAIRWVLGEQSAKSLRGQKMEDIIFQGSDTRNPLNFAEVSLILNNEEAQLPIDYQEVSVTRRVYRSGESEFFINKQSCRLKDIIDLFMDTGLGRESFSIIGQGKIDEILSSKAEERRAVFEEAAGVLKYKQRKTKAQFKLTETEDNLDRVEDIIHEIEQQMEPLKKQSLIAKKYKKMKEQLTEREIALLVTEIDQLHHEWEQLRKQLESDQLKEMKEKTELQQREATITEKRQQLQGVEENITALQNELLVSTERLEQCEGKRNVLIERGKHRQENKEKLLSDQQSLLQHKEEKKQDISLENEHVTNVEETISKIEAEIEGLQHTLDRGVHAVSDEIDELKSDYIEYLNEQAVLQNEQVSIRKQLDQIQQQIKRQQNHDQTYLEEEQSIQSKKVTMDHQVEQLSKTIQHMESSIHQWKNERLANRATYESMQEKLYAGNEYIAKLSSRKDMLEEMKDSFQGFFYGVKEVLQASKRNELKNIEGAVVDLIQVPVNYTAAIDTILGAQAQHIVVPNDQAAREAIAWLKKENKGRATFLPIESIDERFISSTILESIKNLPGFVGIASEMVQTNQRYKKVASHLMGNVIITERLADANEIARRTQRKFRVVTLDGDVVYPGGSMSGGAKKKNSHSLLTREKEIKELEAKITQYVRRAKAFEKEVDECKEAGSQLELKIDEYEQQLEEKKRELQQYQTEQKELELALRRVQEDLSIYQMNLNQYRDEKGLYENKAAKNKQQLAAIEDKISKTEKRMNQLTNELQSIESKERSLEHKLHELQIMKAEQEERKKNHLEKIDTYQHQLSDIDTQLMAVMEQVKEQSEVEEIAKETSSLEQHITELRERRQSKAAELEEKRAFRKQYLQTIEDEESELKGKYNVHEHFVRQIQEKEVQVNRLDVALENRLKTLQSEYVMTYEKAVESYEKVDHIDEVREEVAQLKQAIEHLGAVNLGAIEEYERIMERHHFLTEQQQDLLEAKTTLYNAIKEMDEEMTLRFGDMFSNIQSSFTNVFKKLFGGGRAELILTDPTNLLETGIDIIACPPGKKPKSLGLLSGGERALTAIALLFAILHARPVPFCILDEVDAALDEANVERFGAYLKSFSEGTQFIVISHRKGTMEEADALYGVTMKESGVSRLVSVKLEEADTLIEAT